MTQGKVLFLRENSAFRLIVCMFIQRLRPKVFTDRHETCYRRVEVNVTITQAKPWISMITYKICIPRYFQHCLSLGECNSWLWNPADDSTSSYQETLRERSAPLSQLVEHV